MNFSQNYLSLLITLIFLTQFGCDNSKVERQPNFIIIFTDDLGYGDLSSYGHPTIRTPHLDKMASEGMRFTQFYVGSSICTPSRAALLTGKLPVQTGMYGNRSVLFPDNAGGLETTEKTIAKSLKDLDYKTICVGKWHLGHLKEYMPLNHGFDDFYGIPYSNDMRPESNWDYAQNNFPPLPFLDGIDTLGTSIDQSQFISMFTEKSINFIKENKNNPFFLYLAHSAPHTPLMIDEKNIKRSKRGLYGDVVEELDSSVGKILKTLKELGIDNNTFVIFTSDNGPWGWRGVNGGSASLLKGNKGSVYEGGYRVPAIAWMPGSIDEGITTQSVCSTLDLYPTIMSIAGAKDSSVMGIIGTDISKTFFQNLPVYNNIHYYRQDTLVALRHEEWKIYVNDPEPWNDEYTISDLPLLFNLNHDPSEKYNLSDKNPKIIEKLKQLVDDHLQSVEVNKSQLNEILPTYKKAYDAYNKKS
jgi:arylsulfatase A-like enzyme